MLGLLNNHTNQYTTINNNSWVTTITTSQLGQSTSLHIQVALETVVLHLPSA